MIYKNSSAGSLILKMPIRFGLDALAAYRGLFAGDGGYFIAIAKAHMHFAKWILFEKKKPQVLKSTQVQLQGTYAGSILWQFYVRSKKSFSEFVSVK